MRFFYKHNHETFPELLWWVVVVVVHRAKTRTSELHFIDSKREHEAEARTCQYLSIVYECLSEHNNIIVVARTRMGMVSTEETNEFD